MARTKVQSIPELRRICQDPVRVYNDITGSLYGWRLSIYLTRFFLSLGLGASFASSLMVLTGLGGSLLCVLGGMWTTIGLAILTFSYVLDCVDGEMARYAGIDSYRWAGIDYLHHMLTKGLSFLCLGVGLFRESGNPWLLLAGGACSIFWLLLMGVRDLPMLLFAKKIVANEHREENPAFKRLVAYLEELKERKREHDPPRDIWGADFRFRPWMIRTFFTSFDVVVPLLCVTSLLDLFLPPSTILGLPWTATSAIVALYALLLPLHLADSINTAMRGKQVRNELYDLAAKVVLHSPPQVPDPTPREQES